MAKVTLQTIADQVGVSRMTVSNAFSRPDQLSASLRERILEAARELGYVGPDPSARALARGSTGAVGVLLTDALHYAFADEVAMAFLGAIASELAPTGLALTLLTST
ncbi:MAG: LacI family DNA-binding transcriptional regulator [Oryzihumus sp.]